MVITTTTIAPWPSGGFAAFTIAMSTGSSAVAMGNDRHRKREQAPRERYVTLYHWFLGSDAWRSLGVYARALYIEIRARYNGSNNGEIPFSHREAQTLLGVSNKPIPAAFRELEDKGFIKPVRKGNFDWKVRFEGKGRATTWLLTELPQDWPERGLAPTKDFMHWAPPENKTRYAGGVPIARPKRTISDVMARSKRTNGTPKADHLGKSGGGNGTLSAGTINIPSIPQPIGMLTPQLLKSALFKKAARERSGSDNG